MFQKLIALLRGAQSSVVNRIAFFAMLGGTFVGLVGTAGAATTAQYDISPVVTGLTNDLTANIPVILGAVGALIAIGIGVHMVRRWVRP